MRRSIGRPVLFALLAACGACGGDLARDGTRDATRGDSQDLAADASPGDAALERAATDVVRFLAGTGPLERVALADSVELRVSPDGGGATVRRTREELRVPAAWTVGAGDQRHTFVPPRGMGRVTARAGRHYACTERDLGDVAPDLAPRPHVGVTMQAENARSCLESWSATFVFDTAAGRPPRLIAALYDQWEW